ncbi:ATPase WRNIP1-like [Anopheles funestus]|uniref:ATPase WRNIP1-like n=1 Tax=Anopheles funestus TaxID=62324 RepID=UPI0020C6E94A|nr:ATPase WRNIP1-like [Anopheles funestus]
MAHVNGVDDAQPSTSMPKTECPICHKWFPVNGIELHVDECLRLSEVVEERLMPDSISESTRSITPCAEEQPEQACDGTPQVPKRNFSIFERSPKTTVKRPRNEEAPIDMSSVNREDEGVMFIKSDTEDDEANEQRKKSKMEYPPEKKAAKELPKIPLAELMRPSKIEDYVGQDAIVGQNAILRKLLDSGNIPSLILWGPPGCGKTTLANIIANRCKTQSATLRFVKLSATMAGVAEVKEVIKVAKNDVKYKRRTLLFMDEIHRFNKLQQDIFLPHVESGTITLIGATTENPSFSLNSALLSRCRVIVLEKHSVESMMQILVRALPEYETFMVPESVNNNEAKLPDFSQLSFIPRTIIHEETVRWLAETCDGDARIGLNGLQLALGGAVSTSDSIYETLKTVTLQDVREGIKKSHLLYDRKGDQHYDTISALHKSIRGSDDNAALYWATRMVASGEDPRYICRRMIRMASEDIGLADTNALQVATATLAAVQSVGMPEADCIIAHCAVYLARAPKSREVYEAYKRCRASIDEWKGPMPGVPLHLRNAPTKLMRDLQYGVGYNMLHKDQSGLTYMPEGLEDEKYFSE